MWARIRRPGFRPSAKAVSMLARIVRLVGLALLLASGTLLVGSPGHAGPNWLLAADAREPWRAALDRAPAAREPIMAFVCLENQQLTLLMEQHTFGHIEVDKALRDFLCVRVDALAAANQPFLDAYGAGRKEVGFQVEPGHEDFKVEGQGRGQAYPITLFINPDGELEHMVYGYAKPEVFLQVLQQVQAIMGVHEKLRGNANDARALAELGGLYVELQRYAAGRETLTKALDLDKNNALGIGETAWLDLGIAHLADGQAQQAVEAISKHIGAYPESKLRCKAQFLLGGALLASVEPDRLAKEALTAQGKAAEAAAAAKRLLDGQRQAEEAWAWFEGAKGKVPCEDTEWAGYSLGALRELRAEIAYGPVADEVEALLKEGKPDAAAERLRAFAQHQDAQGHKDFEGTDRGCQALYYAGQVLMKAGKRAEAVAQWRKLADPDPKANPCAASVWHDRAVLEGAAEEAWGAFTKEVDRLVRDKKTDEAVETLRAFAKQYPGTERAGEALFHAGEILLKAGNRAEALREWRRLADKDPVTNLYLGTAWFDRATEAVKANEVP
ncbi:MAG: tetratricopeptide repeat protein [Armatimonadetes bacterium]|nr:tetratricopeptide repeat protein [Armatimonadota bacterium]